MDTLRTSRTCGNTLSCTLGDGLALSAPAAHGQTGIWSRTCRSPFQKRCDTTLSCNEVKEQEEQAGVPSVVGTLEEEVVHSGVLP